MTPSTLFQLISIYSSLTLPNRATCEELLREYKACESPEYITYVRCPYRPPSLMTRVGLILFDRILTPSRHHKDPDMAVLILSGHSLD